MIRFKNRIFILIILSLIFYLIIDFVSYNNLDIFNYIWFFIGIIMLLINIKWGSIYYLAILIFSDDIPRIATEKFTSILSTKFIGSLTFIAYYNVFIFLILCSYFLVRKKRFKVNKLDKYIFVLLSVYIVAAAIGFPNYLHFPRTYIMDFSFIVNIIIFYALIRISFKQKKDIKKIIYLTLIFFAIKSLVGVVYFYLGIGDKVGDNIRPILESGRNFLGFIFFLSLSFLYYFKKIKFKYKIFFFIGGFSSFFHVLTFPSKANFILLLFGFILFILIIFIDRGISIKIFKFITKGITVILLVIIIMSLIRPGSLGTSIWEIKTLFEYNLNAKEYSNPGVVVRIVEIKNILATLANNDNLLLGEGLGGWFDEHYSFPLNLLGRSAYPDRHILMHKYPRPHGMPQNILLKLGIGGLLIYMFVMARFFFSGYVILRQTNHKFFKASLVSILSFLPLVIYKSYSTKIQVMFGILLGILSNILSLYYKSAEKEKEV